MEEGGTEGLPDRTRERSFRLNSRRLTASVIGRLAAGLGVPTGGSLEDTRWMLEGKLEEDGHEPRNVQVVLEGSGEGVAARLEYDGGAFIEIPREGEDGENEGGDERLPEEEEELEAEEGVGRGGVERADTTRVAALREELRGAQAQVEALEGEVSSVRDCLEREITKEKQKYRELWNVYCARSMRDDALISERENELEEAAP